MIKTAIQRARTATGEKVKVKMSNPGDIRMIRKDEPISQRNFRTQCKVFSLQKWIVVGKTECSHIEDKWKAKIEANEEKTRRLEVERRWLDEESRRERNGRGVRRWGNYRSPFESIRIEKRKAQEREVLIERAVQRAKEFIRNTKVEDEIVTKEVEIKKVREEKEKDKFVTIDEDPESMKR